MDKPIFYQIKVKGYLDDTWVEWFQGLTVSNHEDGDALLSGQLPDQAALHGILKRIGSLSLTLISVNAVSEEDEKETTSTITEKENLVNTFTNFRKILFQFNAGFLVLMGGVVSILDYLGFRTGAGPLGRMLHGNDLAVGMQEAHGLAFLFGLVLFLYAVSDARPSWHLICAGIHILLGGSNLVYWNGAVEYGIVGPEIVVTTIHGLLVVLHLAGFFLVRYEPVTIKTQLHNS